MLRCGGIPNPERFSPTNGVCPKCHHYHGPQEDCVDNRTEWLKRKQEIEKRETPLHSDCTGGPVEAINGPKARREYTKGSVEWLEEQRMRNERF